MKGLIEVMRQQMIGLVYGEELCCHLKISGSEIVCFGTREFTFFDGVQVDAG